MKRIACIALAGIACALVAGCSSSPPRSSYADYGELIGKQQASEANLISSIAATANACTDSRCVEHVAAFAALAAAGGRGSPPIAPPSRELSGAEKFAVVFSSMSPFLANVVTGAVQWRQSDNAARTAEAQFSYLDSVLGQAFTGMTTVATNATPSITVGGNYGDTYGHDYTGGNRTQTDVAGHLISGDGTVIGDRNFNSGRQDSAGPFDRTCAGTGCQPVNPAEPAD